MADLLEYQALCWEIASGKDVEENVFRLLECLNVVIKGHFLLSSGLHSDTYVQCAKLFTYPDVAAIICNALYGKLIKDFSNAKIDFVVAPALGAMLCGYELARASGAHNIFCERNAQDVFELRRGFYIPENSVVVIVEDVVTSGKSVQEVLCCLSDYKCNIIAICSVINRSNGNPFNYPLCSLINMDLKTYDANNLPEHLISMPLHRPGSNFNKT
ncbi:Orotate phosphoribosyltransferase [Candidatus Xenohaliotis californiensis]|uniref:Orotate phosphoribosyltransferase n=1 Tax=Candidatus Xenohaliotis californiensis TaxID=84677 RepID=A0ABP0EVJ5_9RICK|nr:Orotate phosphoribosyltransferase [Candidatus Xenohaliotis californiensis]